MIEKVVAYKSSDGKTFGTIEEVQAHELSLLFKIEDFGGAPVVDRVASAILRDKDKIVDILTTTATSKPTARKINGGKKARKAKVTEPELPGTETK